MKITNKKLIFILIILSIFIISCVPDPISTENKDEIIGVVTDDINLNQIFIRKQEAPIGDFITDSFMFFIKNDELTKARAKEYFGLDEFKVDFSIINAGSIRFDKNIHPDGILKKGEDFTVGMLKEILHFESNLYIVQISGSDLKQILEHSVAQIDDVKGQFLQISKELSITIDKSKTAERIKKTTDNTSTIEVQGERITSIKLNGQEIINDPISKYYILTSAYLISGGDDFLTFSEISNTKKLDTQKSYREALKKYIESKKEVEQPTDGRISFIKNN